MIKYSHNTLPKRIGRSSSSFMGTRARHFGSSRILIQSWAVWHGWVQEWYPRQLMQQTPSGPPIWQRWPALHKYLRWITGVSICGGSFPQPGHMDNVPEYDAPQWEHTVNPSAVLKSTPSPPEPSLTLHDFDIKEMQPSSYHLLHIALLPELFQELL